MKNKIVAAITVGAILVGVFGSIAFADPVTATNGPIVPFPPGWVYQPRGLDPVATPDNCPSWYGISGCMRNTNAR